MQKTLAILMSIAAALVVVMLVVLVRGEKLPWTPDDIIDLESTAVEMVIHGKRLAVPEARLQQMDGKATSAARNVDGNNLAWLGSYESYRNEPTSIDVVVINKPTGAQYHITGQRNTSGASCAIKFVGNVNSK